MAPVHPCRPRRCADSGWLRSRGGLDRRRGWLSGRVLPGRHRGSVAQMGRDSLQTGFPYRIISGRGLNPSRLATTRGGSGLAAHPLSGGTAAHTSSLATGTARSG
ncbi:hypothetical protein GCM10007291_41790 [Gemmobacter nanjingensis]|uniref:Uncharacterized protein n=1 Tax=Gemmobacter nanjingensis TaxID=488454 RepID=A0ABQ3FSR5_9RHOB|nr:hypothetical protein GCM10007291_41790 [Gemmobacter nanjingensis]